MTVIATHKKNFVVSRQQTESNAESKADKSLKSVVSFNNDEVGEDVVSIEDAREGGARVVLSDAGTQTQQYFERAKDRAKRLADDEDKPPPKGKPVEMAVQAIMEEQDMGTQFPEIITREEADKLWFQDSTVQQQRKIYTLEQIWRFLSVQIKHSNIIEDKLKAIDAEENDCGDEGDSEMSEATMAQYKL